MVVGWDNVDFNAGYAKEGLPLQALRIEARPSALGFVLAPCKDIQTRPRPRSFGGSFGQRVGGERRQGKQLEQLADGGRHGEPAGARIGAGDGGHVEEGEGGERGRYGTGCLGGLSQGGVGLRLVVRPFAFFFFCCDFAPVLGIRGFGF